MMKDLIAGIEEGIQKIIVIVASSPSMSLNDRIDLGIIAGHINAHIELLKKETPNESRF